MHCDRSRGRSPFEVQCKNSALDSEFKFQIGIEVHGAKDIRCNAGV